jgi:hypothetical protein
MKIRNPDIPVRALGQGCPIYEETGDERLEIDIYQPQRKKRNQRIESKSLKSL